jgi:Lar family restriction alleviation protein
MQKAPDGMNNTATGTQTDMRLTQSDSPDVPTLLPCPFCGGNAYQVQIGNAFTKSRGYEVGCKNCRVKITDMVITHDLEWIRPKNIANWNTRTSPDIAVEQR